MFEHWGWVLGIYMAFFFIAIICYSGHQLLKQYRLWRKDQEQR